MNSWWNNEDRLTILYWMYIYGRRIINILVIGIIVYTALTGITSVLIYRLGWEEYIPINTTWSGVNEEDRYILEPELLIGNSYLDSYYVFYNFPGYFFFSFFWTASRYLPFYPGVVFVIMSILAGSMISVVAIRIIAQHMAKRRVVIGITGRASFKRIGRYVLVNTVYWFLVVALINTAIGIPLAIFIAFKYMFAGHATLFEDNSIKNAIKRSSHLFSNYWLRTVSYVFLLTIIAIIVAGSMALIPVWGSTFGIMLATLIPPTFITVYYIQIRIEKEAFNTSELIIDLDSWSAGVKPIYPVRAEREAEQAERRERWDDYWERKKLSD